MMTGMVVLCAVMFGFIAGFVRRREDCGSGRDHEPRALKLLTSGHHTCTWDGSGFAYCKLCETGHVCEFVETKWGEDVLSICLTCKKPPPMPIPGDGVRMLR